MHVAKSEANHRTKQKAYEILHNKNNAITCAIHRAPAVMVAQVAVQIENVKKNRFFPPTTRDLTSTTLLETD